MTNFKTPLFDVVTPFTDPCLVAWSTWNAHIDVTTTFTPMLPFMLPRCPHPCYHLCYHDVHTHVTIYVTTMSTPMLPRRQHPCYHDIHTADMCLQDNNTSARTVLFLQMYHYCYNSPLKSHIFPNRPHRCLGFENKNFSLLLDWSNTEMSPEAATGGD